jgi:hypothetical protein
VIADPLARLRAPFREDYVFGDACNRFPSRGTTAVNVASTIAANDELLLPLVSWAGGALRTSWSSPFGPHGLLAIVER